ncbi:MAG TPA: hypothetical protein VHN55_03560 [Sphingomicrobium sp.]|nr:hypothetical protein [Sphingomicrobium sp.]
MADKGGEGGVASRSARDWWERPYFLVLIVALSAVPLLYPDIPPLVDLFGHMGRYRVQLDIGNSPWLREYYGFHWAAIVNLGVDLLVMPLGRLMGLEPSVKLLVVAIPPITVAGFLWVAREVHGRIPPTAFFAIPFAYGHPFLFGFVNFGLSIAFAFLAFGLWLRLGRLDRTRLRAWLFVPISLVIFFCHTYGWGVLGLLCFSAEAVRQHDRGIGWIKAAVAAALHASVMALPLLVMLIWRSETHGGATADWFNWEAKWRWLLMALRDRWEWWDKGALIVCAAVFLLAAFHRSLAFSRNLAFSALVLAVGYILLPRIIFGSAYADMRLVPYALAVVLLAIRFRDDVRPRFGSALAALGLAFVLARLAGTTASMTIAANDQQAKLAALDHVPMGARVVTLVGDPCGYSWPLPRNSHLGAMVVVRKHGFSNDQWVMEGLNLLDLRYPEAGHFSADPSQRVRPQGCGAGTLWTIDRALREVNPRALDYVWLVDPPPFDRSMTADMETVWRGPGSILYRLR